jgi:hypothetical protein
MEKKFIKLTEDEFYERFNPIKNHFYKNPEDCSYDGCMFETYGQELDYITELINDGGKASVWTIEEVEGRFYFVSGYHFVNRFGYLVTNEPVPENEEYEVLLDTEVDEPKIRKAKLVKEITVIDPDTKGKVKLTVYKSENGGMFAMDSSFLDQCYQDEIYSIIRDPFESEGNLMLMEENSLTNYINDVDLPQD